MKKTTAQNSRAPHSGNNVSPQEVWRLASKIPMPLGYWSGKKIESGFAPDNILVFTSHLESRHATHGQYHSRFVLDVCIGHPRTIHIGETDHRLEKGDCVLIFPRQYNLGLNDPEAKESREGWVVVTFDLRNDTPIAALRDSPRVMQPRHWRLLRDLLEAYQQAAASLQLAWSLAQLLLALVNAPRISPERTAMPSTTPLRDELLEHVNRYLYQHPEPDSSLPGLAREMKYSEGHLRKLFREHVGMSLGLYVRRKRISEAARQLQISGKSITEITRDLGFSSVPAFSRMFKAIYGVSPKRFEKLVRNGDG